MECLKKTAYDQFYNEHIYVFSLISIMNLMKKYNLEVFDVKKLKTHGGSMRYFIKKKEFKLECSCISLPYGIVYKSLLYLD